MREIEMRIPVAKWLLSRQLIPICEVGSLRNCDFIGVKLSETRPMLLTYMVAVELKLSNVAGVIRQCLNHQPRANETWAAMRPISKRMVEKFRALQIGLIFVENNVEVILPAPIYERNLQRWRNVAMRRRHEHETRLLTPNFLKGHA